MRGHNDGREKSGSSEHQASRCTGSGHSAAVGVDSDHGMEDQVRQRGSDPILGATESHRSLTYRTNGSTDSSDSLATAEARCKGPRNHGGSYDSIFRETR